MDHSGNDHAHGSDAFSIRLIDLTGQDSLILVNINISVDDPMTLVVTQSNSIDAPFTPSLLGGMTSTLEERVEDEDEILSWVLEVIDNADGLHPTSPITLSQPPLHGIATFDQTSGAVEYAPEHEYVGQDTIGFQLEDGNGHVSTLIIPMVFEKVNDGIATSNPASLAGIEDLTLVQLLTIHDLDGISLSGILPYSVQNGALSFAAIEQPEEIASDPTRAQIQIQYQPNDHFYGVDNILISVDDNQEHNSIVAVPINVANTPDALILSSSLTPDATQEDIPVQGNATYLDYDGMAFNPVSVAAPGPQNGTVSILQDTETYGEWQYTPDAHFHGTDAFQIVLTDAFGDTVMLPHNIEISSVNDPISITLTSEVATANQSTSLDAGQSHAWNAILINEDDVLTCKVNVVDVGDGFLGEPHHFVNLITETLLKCIRQHLDLRTLQ